MGMKAGLICLSVAHTALACDASLLSRLRSACEYATIPSYSRLPAGTVYVSTAAAAATAFVAADSLSVQVPRPRHSEVYDG
jgi:hypothetical protein